MKKKFYIFILTIIFGASIVFLICIFYFNQNESIGNNVSLSTFDNKENIVLPFTLIIPKLNLESHIVSVGVTKEGDMATPEKSLEAGWYKFGTVPGQEGSAVIAGHLDDYLGLPAIFSRLSELLEGDDVYVIGSNGEKLHFQVTHKKVFDYKLSDTKEIFGKQEGAGLNLITCNGSWMQNVQNYDKRLVVFTELKK